ncbi:MAG: ATP synthase F1 subunit gamma [Lachnospiraceae bacterium]|nr:ATP synthase F1 subunit gamma [Lachnospiraceae bacterium]
MASMRDIKRRKTGIQSTQQITKAMKLVSTVKLQRAKARAQQIKNYTILMYDTIVSIINRSGYIDHPLMKPNGSSKKAVILITSNRGLAGGYNSNIIKLVTQSGWDTADTEIYAIGRKGRDGVKRKGFEVVYENSDMIEEPIYADAMDLAGELLAKYAEGSIGEIYIAYTIFKNTVVHVPKLQKLLPLGKESTPTESVAGTEGEDNALPDPEKETARRALMTYEPDEDEALSAIIPKYVTNLIYGALIEAVASENGARMQAMDSATDNAEKMISNLELQYNRARQGAITQELTEIIGGADALSS